MSKHPGHYFFPAQESGESKQEKFDVLFTLLPFLLLQLANCVRPAAIRKKVFAQFPGKINLKDIFLIIAKIIFSRDSSE